MRLSVGTQLPSESRYAFVARMARELADELEAGTGPELGDCSLFNDEGQPHCAVGHLVSRCGDGDTGATVHQAIQTALDMEEKLWPASTFGQVVYGVQNANDDTPAPLRSRAVVQPLRDLATAIEAL